MIDTLFVTVEAGENLISYFTLYLEKKECPYIHGSGRYGYKKSMQSELVYIYYTYENGNFEASIQFKHYLSNKHGLHVLKPLLPLLTRYRVTRIDIAYDIYESFEINPFKIEKMPHQAKPKIPVYVNPYDPDIINTANFITKAFMIRAYDKGVEQKRDPIQTNWKRVEVELRKDFIQSKIGKSWHNPLDPILEIKKIYYSLLNDILDRYSFGKIYDDILKKMTIHDYRPHKNRSYSDISDKMEYFKGTYDHYFEAMVLQYEEKVLDLINSSNREKARKLKKFYTVLHGEKKKNQVYTDNFFKTSMAIREK